MPSPVRRKAKTSPRRKSPTRKASASATKVAKKTKRSKAASKKATSRKTAPRPAHPPVDGTEVRQSAIHGKGLFATRSFKRGEVMGRYEGKRTQRNGMHVLWVMDEDGVEYGINGQNALRFMNHSMKPNGELDGPQLIAGRAIRTGDEITIDYGEDWWEGA